MDILSQIPTVLINPELALKRSYKRCCDNRLDRITKPNNRPGNMRLYAFVLTVHSNNSLNKRNNNGRRSTYYGLHIARRLKKWPTAAEAASTTTITECYCKALPPSIVCQYLFNWPSLHFIFCTKIEIITSEQSIFK